jgi:hypothetical protein
MDGYFVGHAVDGITMDSRYDINPPEAIRQSVVCQLLGYAELDRMQPSERTRAIIARDADFLISRYDEIRSHTPFDGMLGYAMLSAFEATGEPRFQAAAAQVVDELLTIPTSQCILNGGLMVAMATAQYAKLTGNAEAAQKTRDIIAQLVPYQNEDGSFPHWCSGSRDIHYTGWMAMELIHIERMMHDDLIPSFLSTMSTFLEGRIALNGQAIYEEPCPDYPGCMQYFYSRATGCSYDLDSRGWTVEPAYCGVLFDRQGSAKYPLVMGFLDSLETGGTVADLYGYWPPSDDPEYPWTIADTSVVNMSIILWVLTTTVAERMARGIEVTLTLDDLIDTTATPPPPPPPLVTRTLAVAPNPTPGGCELRFSLSAPRPGSLVVFDASGREVRALASGGFTAGDHAPHWDGRDDDGRIVPNGVYLVRLQLDHDTETRRVVLLR